MDPLRLGLVAVLLSQSRPILNLLAFWLGGVTAGVGVAMAALVFMRDVALSALQSMASTIAGVRSAVPIFTGGRFQITLGVIALLSVLVLLIRERLRAARPTVMADVGDQSDAAVQPRMPSLFARLGAVTQNVLQRGFVWSSFVVGLGSATPPVETLGLLAIIMASGAAIGTQFSAFLLYTLIVLAVIEIPLVGYLATPEKTQVVMMWLQNALRVHRRRISQTAITITGVACLVQGIGSL